VASVNLRPAIARNLARGYFETLDTSIDGLIVGQLRAYGVDGIAVDARSEAGAAQRIAGVATPTDAADAATKAYVDGFKPAWSVITGKPTTLGGFGITDAYTRDAADAAFKPSTYVPSWTEISGKPSLLALVAASSTDAAVTKPLGSTNSGSSTTAARSDHAHAHGDQAGGTLHAAAVANGPAGFLSGADKAKLDGIAAGANAYAHPATHPPSIIAQDANNRFVTDADKTKWNEKQDALGFTPYNATNPAGYLNATTVAPLLDSATGLKDGFKIGGSATNPYTVTAAKLDELTGGVEREGRAHHTTLHGHGQILVYVGLAKEQIHWGDPVFTDVYGEARRSLATDPDAARVVGVCMKEVNEGDPVFAVAAGFLAELGGVGEELFLGADGGLDTTYPTEGRVIRVALGCLEGSVVQIAGFGE
jgi:hypothetical protein